MLFALLGLLFAGRVQAGPEHNVSGWAWSGNLGWISFNNTTSGAVINYGVHICTGDGDALCGHLATPRGGRLTGFAWSRGTTADVGGIGWIRFDPAGPFPGAPNYSACLDFPGTGQVCDGVGDWMFSGWARAERAITPEGQTLGGWDGWISMRGTIQAGGTYGVWLNNIISPMQFRGYAWGGDAGGNSEAVVGWISFNCIEGGVGGTNICATSNYKVTTTLNVAPTVTNPLESLSYCNISPGEGLTSFSWTYNDADNDNQTHYGLRVWRAGTLVV
ncbi:MAG: hypothetical protein KY055_01025, partial [Candidatus Nealsonbacteria bacterium]|nr:hypothetical protein [Candidatus Nealsonbacteria bacterium]